MFIPLVSFLEIPTPSWMTSFSRFGNFAHALWCLQNWQPMVGFAYVRGSTNGTIGITMPSRVLPLVAPMAPKVPILTTIGRHFCRHPRAWAKLPDQSDKQAFKMRFCSKIVFLIKVTGQIFIFTDHNLEGLHVNTKKSWPQIWTKP